MNICKGWDNPLAPTWRALPKQNQRNLFRGDRLHRLHLHLRRRQALPPLPRVAQAPSHLQHICLHQVSIFTFSGVLVSSYTFQNQTLISVLMAVFTILCVPETRGRSLAEIQSMYGEVGFHRTPHIDNPPILILITRLCLMYIHLSTYPHIDNPPF